jgi:hypothetical protein
MGGMSRWIRFQNSVLSREVDVHISWGRVELRERIKEGLMTERVRKRISS